MKKTLTANISGTVFHIEEDAYDKLQRYLASIRAQFSGSDGRDEIMADIEARIAELFTERMDGKRQVVNTTDVEHVIGIMGQPEDYMGDPLEAGEKSSDQGAWSGMGQRRHKRLFRDPDDKWVGGVIGGLGAYFNVDPLWFRIAFITLLLVGKGTPLLIYALLWILVPMAETAAERLMMQGEPVTVDNLKKTFEEGADKVKSGAQRVVHEADELGKKWNSSEGRQRFRSGAQNVGSGLAVVIQKFFGLAFLIGGFLFTMSMIGALIGSSTFSYSSDAGWSGGGFIELGGLVFNSSMQATWFLASACLLGLIPAIGLMLAGIRLLFEIRTPSWLGWMMGVLWSTALVVVIITASQVGFDFSKHQTVEAELPMLQPEGQVLYLENLDNEPRSRRNHVSYKHGNLDWEMDDLQVDEDSIRLCWTTMDVQRSNDSLYHIRMERRAQGNSYKLAHARAMNIGTTMHQVDSVVFLSQWLAFPRSDKFRVQRAHLVLEVPVGKAVHFGNHTGPLLDDVDNVTNTYDGDMVGITWTMTRRGLSKDIAPEQVPDEVLPIVLPIPQNNGHNSEKSNVPVPADGPVVSSTPSQEKPIRSTSLVPNVLGLLFQRI